MNSARKHVQASRPCQPKLAHWVDRALDSLLPAQCLLCTSKPQGHGFCSSCLHRLPRMEFGCQRCAAALTEPHSALCGRCLQQPPAQDRSWGGYHYRDGIRELLWQLKFKGALKHAKHLGGLLAAQCPLELITPGSLVIPAPLHLSRLRARGFNQARELIRPLANELNLPVQPDLLIRTRATQEQSHLDAKQRWRNVANAFACRERLCGESIVLFDDVMTTGATMQAMARCLKQSGAGTVTAICLARA